VRWRLVAWSGGVTLAVLLLLGALLYASVASSLAEGSTAQLRGRAAALVEAIERGRPVDRQLLGLVFGGQRTGTIAYVVDPQGQWLGPPDIDLPELPDRAGVAAARRGQVDVRTVSRGEVPLRIHSQVAQRGARRFVVQVVADRSAEVEVLRRLVAVLVVGGLGAVAAAGAAGFIYAGRALVPIRESLRRQREFAADASHELRTPLAVVRASVEHLRRHPRRRVGEVGTALEDIEAEVGRLTRLVDDLLLLARADSGAVELERRTLDLADSAAEALGSLTPLAQARSVALVLDPQPAPTVGDPDRLSRVIGILVDNAVRHTPPEGRVTVRTRAGRGEVRVLVEDEGPGVRDEDLPRIFDRFWRARDAPEGGTGLGLAIARWVVERHGGSISVERLEPRGARFTVRLPA
jgi:signal transduction histidine kinase